MSSTALGEYAGQALKASSAVQPKGCSARFVPFPSGKMPDFPDGMQKTDFPNVHTADFPELILILRKKKCKEAASITA